MREMFEGTLPEIRLIRGLLCSKQNHNYLPTYLPTYGPHSQDFQKY